MDFKKTLEFLKKLSRNNNREWFERNKPTYLSIKGEFEEFVADVLNEMIPYDKSLEGLDPMKLTFRIYRDIRFSKNKTPYKTFLSAGMSSRGKGTGAPGYYFQIEPGNKSMIASGLYLPPTEDLAKIRQEIDYNGETFKAVVSEKKFKKIFGELWDGDKLKTMPKGYPKDHPNIEYLKLKHFMAMHTFSDEDVLSRNFIKKLVESMKVSKPLNDFLWEALG